jgi:hypothetical protein
MSAKRCLRTIIALAVLCGSFPLLAKQPPAPLPAASEAFSRERLNQLVERDRPRDLIAGSSMDLKTYKKYEKEVKRQAERLGKAEAEYRRTRSVTAWRTMLDAINRGGGLRDDELVGGGPVMRALMALHEVGPPIDDPENGGNAEFAARRHHAMMRLLSRHMWNWKWTSDGQQRMMAFYLQDCERRPSPDRPTGNNHDPDCGFIFEMDYKLQRVGDRPWEDQNMPQTWAAFAAGEPSSRPDPLVRYFIDYPLHLGRPPKSPNELWAGNEQGLIKFYNQDYVANRAYQEQRYAEELARQNADSEQRLARIEREWEAMLSRQQVLAERWDTLWATPSLPADLQTELENISEALNRLDIYRTRYQIISYDRVVTYCRLGIQSECYRQFAFEDNERAERVAQLYGGSGGGGSASTGSALVTVRAYDRNGNFLGSSVTTRIDAQLSGAR